MCMQDGSCLDFADLNVLNEGCSAHNRSPVGLLSPGNRAHGCVPSAMICMDTKRQAFPQLAEGPASLRPVRQPSPCASAHLIRWDMISAVSITLCCTAPPRTPVFPCWLQRVCKDYSGLLLDTLSCINFLINTDGALGEIKRNVLTVRSPATVHENVDGVECCCPRARGGRGRRRLPVQTGTIRTRMSDPRMTAWRILRPFMSR